MVERKNMKYFDGAFGTYYISKTNDFKPCEKANITNEEMVLSIHKEYINAGVNAIKTNTFSANKNTFKDVKERNNIITKGFLIAKQAVENTEVEVFADIGPINIEEDGFKEYIEIVDIFMELGATNFLFETRSSFDEIVPALEQIKSKVKNAVIVVSFAVSRDGYTANGLNYKNLIEKAVQNENVDVVGLNCICGPAHVLSLVKELGQIEKPLSVMPNAGYPTSVNGRLVYHDNIGYFAEKLLEIKNAGASILGGCCGTTPQHIKNAIKHINTEVSTKKTVKDIQIGTKALFNNEKKLKRKPIAVELDPPPDGNISFLLEAAEKLKNCGINTVTLADSPLAKTRADSFMTSAFLRKEKEIDVIPHLTCRDKNHIAIKGALLGASFSNINKVLVITGDPIMGSSDFRNPSVFNFNSKELIKYIKSLNNEVFSDKPFTIGGALNVNARNFSHELKRSKEKIESGVDFLFAQPLFSKQSIENFKKARQELDCKLYAGVMPFVSYRNAVFLNNEVFGIDIPQNIVDSLEDKTPLEAQDVAIEFCSDIIEQVYDSADGFYLMTPMKKIDLICNLIKRCFDD